MNARRNGELARGVCFYHALDIFTTETYHIDLDAVVCCDCSIYMDAVTIVNEDALAAVLEHCGVDELSFCLRQIPVWIRFEPNLRL